VGSDETLTDETGPAAVTAMLVVAIGSGKASVSSIAGAEPSASSS